MILTDEQEVAQEPDVVAGLERSCLVFQTGNDALDERNRLTGNVCITSEAEVDATNAAAGEQTVGRVPGGSTHRADAIDVTRWLTC